MHAFEAVVIAYLAFFAVAALFARVERRERVAHRDRRGVDGGRDLRRGADVSAGGSALAAVPLHRDRLLDSGAARAVAASGGAFEAWLRRTDAAVRRARAGVPDGWLHRVELGYLACFPLVPVAFAAVWIAGSPADVARFWLGGARRRLRRATGRCRGS